MDSEICRKLLKAIEVCVSSSAAALSKRIDALQARFEAIPAPEKGEKGDPGENGKDGLPGDRGEKGETGERGEKGDIGPQGEKGLDGRDGRDGKDGRHGQDGVDGEPGQNGKDADESQIIARLTETVTKLFDSMPRPKDGKSVTVDDIRAVVESESAKWQLDFEKRAAESLQRVIDKIPAPKDGFTPDDFDVAVNGRVFTISMRCGERVVTREIKVPFPVDRGVYRSTVSYEKGDVVTYGGSQWIAEKDTSTKPPSDDWRLQVRRGSDGKDAK